MTDEQIIKALECCTSDKCTCLDCPYEDSKHIINEKFEVMPNGKTYDVWCCDEWLKVDLLDLFHRLKAENERLEQENHLFADIGKMYSEIKAEAIKEFAERVKTSLNDVARWSMHGDNNEYFIIEKPFIDNLVKEMVGEDQ